VCAGIADYFDWDVNIVRIIWVVATLCGVPIMITLYIVAAWLLDPKPGSAFSRSRFRWHDVDTARDPISPRYRFADAKARFEQLERRLQKIESVVTSREFRMDRELRGTERP
jgi:phage shock protein C